MSSALEYDIKFTAKRKLGYNYCVIVPVLYVVATPIGNLEDITLRALRVLGEVQLIAAEDTRTSRKLLSRYNIKTGLTSYYEHNKKSKMPVLLKMLEKQDIALISEAGTPGISDPGYELIRGAIEKGFKVEVLPGPSAVTTALAGSGLPADQFLYLGFLPRKKGEKRRLLGSVSLEPRTMICFESPYRVVDSLSAMLETLGDRNVAVCREMSKLHEEVFRGLLSAAIRHFNKPRGEFTIVIQGIGNVKKSLRKIKDKSKMGV
ncbi:MAG: 16S rRNA (cytidine(1402)-2'-O)-methyltransferase [Dehalococcoidia bacterium]|nr:16S rRNA (cytidine(1402)-2'-O)-methyltransferase [Dehalococcoidia bacterium]MDD5648100.1 16S rRNA (cytidine(1402)-2'-O)-methyltransferase [Dehalococcoidia bacterium]